MRFFDGFFSKDAAPAVARTATDAAIVNSMSGIGTGRDKSTHAIFQPLNLPRKTLTNTYKTSWLAGKGIDTPAEDMTREGRVWSELSQAELDAIEALEQRLQIWAKLTDSLKWSRLHGGDALILGLSPTLGEPDVEIPYEKIKKDDLLYLRQVSMEKLKCVEYEQDATSPNFLEPKVWLYKERKVGSGKTLEIKIHDDRIIRLKGRQDPDSSLWGMSELQRVYEELMLNSKLVSAISHLTEEIKIDTYLITDLIAMLAQNCGEDKLKKYFEVIQTQSSYVNARVLDANTKIERKEVTFAGVPQIWQEIIKQISGAFDIPITRLFGTAASGLQNTGEGDLKNYYSSIRKQQEATLRPALEKLDKVMFPASGVKSNDKQSFSFAKLFIENEEQQAKTAAVWGGVAKSLSESGLFSENALQQAISSKLDETGLLKIQAGGLNASNLPEE